MSGATVLIVAVVAILNILSGWLVPVIFKSQRPYGLWGDILVCTLISVALAIVRVGLDPARNGL